MDWRQVNDLETHLGNRNQTLGCGLEVSRGPGLGLRVENRAFAARKELVPGCRTGKLSLTLDCVNIAESYQTANWVLCHLFQNRWRFCLGKAGLSRFRLIAQFLGELY